MATSAFLGANPLTSWKQSSPITLSRLRPLPTKPFQFTAATFKTHHPSSSSSSTPKYDLKLKCSSSSENSHFTCSDDRASQSKVNPTQDPSLETIANELLSNVLKGLKTPVVDQNPPLDAIFHETFSNALKGLETAPATENPLEAIFNETLSTALKVLKTPAMAAVLFALLLTFDPNSAWAASGGRVGGRSSSSRSRSSSSRSSSSSWSRSSSPSYSSSSKPLYSSSSSSWSSPSSSSTSPSTSKSEAETRWLYNIILILILLAIVGYLVGAKSSAAATSHVVKLQVGLLGSARALQKDLDRIAETANTSTSEGLSYVLTEATVALLRHPDYWISSYSSLSSIPSRTRTWFTVQVKVTPNQNMEDAEKCFNKISIEERAKFDEETLVNVNNRRRKSSTSKQDDGFQNEYIVVTLLVDIEGKHTLPTINSSADLKEALENLGSIPSNNILAAEVLWTPQEENDTLSVEELIEDYPLLKRF